MSLARFAAASTLVLAAACSSNTTTVPRHQVVKDMAPVDLDGSYLFESVDACVRSTTMTPDAALLLPLEDIRPGSEVVVEETADHLRFRFIDRNGRRREVEVPIEDATRRGDHLLFRDSSTRPAFFPGIAGQSQSCSVYRGDDGSLVMLNRAARTGLALFLVPFRDRSEMVVTLKPAQ